MGGLVLDKAVGTYSEYVVYQPIINGIGGNLVSVQSSRISTMFHQTSLPGVIPPHTKRCISPWKALFKGGKNCLMALNLFIQYLVFSVFFKNRKITDSHVCAWPNSICVPS